MSSDIIAPPRSDPDATTTSASGAAAPSSNSSRSGLFSGFSGRRRASNESRRTATRSDHLSAGGGSTDLGLPALGGSAGTLSFDRVGSATERGFDETSPTVVGGSGTAAAGAEAQQQQPGSMRSSGATNASNSLRESLRRNSMNTMNFLRNVMGQRNQDYVSDVQMRGSSRLSAAQPQPRSARAGPIPGSSFPPTIPEPGVTSPAAIPSGAAAAAPAPAAPAARAAGGFWSRLFCCNGTGCCGAAGGGSYCCANRSAARAAAQQRRKRQVSHMLNTRIWKFVLVSFTVVLLFGAQVRTLLIPKAADPAMDGLFFIAFVFFWLDMLARMDAEVNYFHLYLCGAVAYSSGISSSSSTTTTTSNTTPTASNNNHRSKNHRHNNNPHASSATTNTTTSAAESKRQRQQQQIGQGYALPGCCGYTSSQAFRVGSFLFFCDLVSTLVMLREISFVAKDRFDLEWVNLDLDSDGLIEHIAGSVNVNQASPVEFDSIDLLAIIGKTARIARFIRSSTAVKISARVNWFLLLNMLNPLWWLEQCWDRRRVRRNNNAANNAKSGGSSKSVTTKGGGGGGTTAGGAGADSSTGAATGGDAAAAGLPTEITTHDDVLRTWGSIVLGVRAQAQLQGSRQSMRGWMGRTLNWIGIRTQGDREELRRQVAATKIQRAWRKIHSRGGYDTSSDEMMDVAWKGRGIATNAMDRELQQRSFMINKRTVGGNNKRSSPSKLASFGMTTGGATAAPSSQEDLSETRKRRNESQVGTAMRELSGQRVAMGIILALCVTVLFTYTENNATRPSTMMVLHTQTANADFAQRSLQAARSSSVPDLYAYIFADGQEQWFELTGEEAPDKLREREKIRIIVKDANNNNTTGYFAYRNERREEALVSLLSTLFVLLVWFFGVTSFAGPVMILVVVPIERMVRLLGMLMLDPLGYQGTSRYKRFVAEEAEITKNTHWTAEVLKGMETSFLMSTILRIGSLMKVGFGSAGVEIIRSNLQKGQTKNQLMLSSQGSTVSCIFLFSDIRQFTDATECLQEEVFVFTNRIAAVVHSICHSYGGSANKNIGDAFLLSWLLEEETGRGDGGYGAEVETFTAKDNQADKALLSVVKICVALHHDEYYVKTMSEAARGALLAKLSKRKGPIVQMGFGLHAGKAVQGAIGSTRKIDATYVSEAVERAEFLESSTKKYGLQMLMSDSFHRLLHPNNRRRCRKIDQIIIRSDDADDENEGFPEGDIVELLTYDMDIDALWKEGNNNKAVKAATNLSTRSEQGGRESDSDLGSEKGSKREGLRMPASMRQMKGGRRRSLKFGKDGASDEFMSDGAFLAPGANNAQTEATEVDGGGPAELVLPTGPALYNASVWTNDDMRKMRQRYTDGLFFHNFNAGLQSFYAKDWDHAKQSFVTILDRFEDGPSRYFLNQIETHKGKPPRGFLGYGLE